MKPQWSTVIAESALVEFRLPWGFGLILGECKGKGSLRVKCDLGKSALRDSLEEEAKGKRADHVLLKSAALMQYP